MLVRGRRHARVLADDWTVAILEGGLWVLTAPTAERSASAFRSPPSPEVASRRGNSLNAAQFHSPLNT